MAKRVEHAAGAFADASSIPFSGVGTIIWDELLAKKHGWPEMALTQHAKPVIEEHRKKRLEKNMDNEIPPKDR